MFGDNCPEINRQHFLMHSLDRVVVSAAAAAAACVLAGRRACDANVQVRSNRTAESATATATAPVSQVFCSPDSLRRTLPSPPQNDDVYK